MAEATEMRMAELARRSELSVPTIKYYLREGLLQQGRRTSVNQAVYNDAHLERLRLIRALTSVAGLPLSKVREVVEAVSSEPTVIDAMAVAQDVLLGDGAQAETTETDVKTSDVLDRVIAERGWRCEKTSPAYSAAVNAVDELEREELTVILDRLGDYAVSAEQVGRIDLDTVETVEGLEEKVRGVVLGSVLRRSLLEALVLLAQQHFAQEHFAQDFTGPGASRRR